jgi:protein TonB
MYRIIKIFTILLYVFQSADVFACTCNGENGVAEEIKQSDVVFLGTIFDRQEVHYPDTLNKGQSGKNKVVKYSICTERVFKGSQRNDTTFIITPKLDEACGFHFQIGKKYIVYAQHYKTGVEHSARFYIDSQSAFYTTTCNRTKLSDSTEIAEIEKELDRLQGETQVCPMDDKPPVYKNGAEKGMWMFIAQNLKYPQGEDVEGRVFVGFTVDSLGNVKDVEIKKGLSPKANIEAMRIVKLLTFYPATLNGNPVEMKMVLPILFVIQSPNQEQKE